MKNIIVTGGAGFIGSNLTLELQKRYPDSDITVIDDFSLGNFKTLKGFKGDVIAEDLSSFKWEENFKKVDMIFHQAAITDTTVMNQKEMMIKNTHVFKDIIKFSMKNNSKIVYASSAATYGNAASLMIEGKDEAPENIYGFSKLICDNIARKTIKDNKKLHIVGLKYFNVYGPKEEYKGKMASMIWQLHNQIKEGKSPRIFKYGEQKRDFVYIKDVIKANICAMTGPSGIFNVGTGKAETFNKVVEELQKNMKTKKAIEYFDNPYKFYQNYTQADLTNARKWNYFPDYNIEKGIKDYIGIIRQE